MKTYASELAARLPRVAPEYDLRNVRARRQLRLGRAGEASAGDARAHGSISMHFLSLYVPLRLPPRFVDHDPRLDPSALPAVLQSEGAPVLRDGRALRVRPRRARHHRRRAHGRRSFALPAASIEAKVRVIPLGVGEPFSAAAVAHAGPRPYILYVGNHRPHKDLATLFDAWSALPGEMDADLYVTGADDFDGELQRRRTRDARDRRARRRARGTLAAYYAGARALVQPALREGFGLPMRRRWLPAAPSWPVRRPCPGPWPGRP